MTVVPGNRRGCDSGGGHHDRWGIREQAGRLQFAAQCRGQRTRKLYVGDRENQRIEIFDAEGNFLKQWTGIGHPYGLFITADQHVRMIDGGFDRIVELDANGKIIGALGEPGHAPGRFAWGHFLAIGRDGKIYAADVLNWRFQVFVPTDATGKMAKYVPSSRMFWDRVASSEWSTRSSVPKN